MSEATETGATERYERFGSMSLAELQDHLGELAVRFDDVRDRYSGPISKHRRRIKDKDQVALGDMFGDLLPMSHNPHLSEEMMANVSSKPEDLTLSRITSMIMDISTFLARFENSGISVVSGGFTD